LFWKSQRLLRKKGSSENFRNTHTMTWKCAMVEVIPAGFKVAGSWFSGWDF
jgi:hypothetical protein